MSYYREQLEQFLGNLDVDADVVLDVGGGQRTLAGRTQSWNVGAYHCLDLPEYDLDRPFEYPLHGDLVFCLEVFEYLIVPTTALQNICRLLQPWGKAIVSFPFVYPLHNEIERDSLRYTITGIRRLAEFAGLQIDQMHPRKTLTDSLVRYYQEDRMHAVEGYDHNVTGYIVEFSRS